MSLVWADRVTWRESSVYICSCRHWLLLKITWKLKSSWYPGRTRDQLYQNLWEVRPKHQEFLKLPRWFRCVAKVKTFALHCRMTKGPRHGERLPLVPSGLRAPSEYSTQSLSFTLWYNENALCVFKLIIGTMGIWSRRQKILEHMMAAFRLVIWKREYTSS